MFNDDQYPKFLIQEDVNEDEEEEAEEAESDDEEEDEEQDEEEDEDEDEDEEEEGKTFRVRSGITGHFWLTSFIAHTPIETLVILCFHLVNTFKM